MRRDDVDTTKPKPFLGSRFAAVWVTYRDESRTWLPYESKAGQWLYALFVDPFLALTAGLLYQLWKGYREPLHETLNALRVLRRLNLLYRARRTATSALKDAQEFQRLIEEWRELPDGDPLRLSDGVYVKLRAMNKRELDRAKREVTRLYNMNPEGLMGADVVTTSL